MHGADSPVPMAFRVLVERCEHDREDDFYIVTDKVAKVFIVPEIEGTLCDLVDAISRRNGIRFHVVLYLEVWACNGLCQLMEQRFLHFGKLIGIHDLKYILHLIQEHYFLSAINFWPIPEKPKDDLKFTVSPSL